MKIPSFEKIFAKDPKRGAEYLGDITRISIWLREADEAGRRARVAVRLGRKALWLEYQKKASGSSRTDQVEA
jgi:hypothetical protein